MTDHDELVAIAARASVLGPDVTECRDCACRRDARQASELGLRALERAEKAEAERDALKQRVAELEVERNETAATIEDLRDERAALQTEWRDERQECVMCRAERDAERDKLEQMVAQEKQFLEAMAEHHEVQQAAWMRELAECQALLAVTQAGLRFYADPINWACPPGKIGTIRYSAAELDMGERACVVLSATPAAVGEQLAECRTLLQDILDEDQAQPVWDRMSVGMEGRIRNLLSTTPAAEPQLAEPDCLICATREVCDMCREAARLMAAHPKRYTNMPEARPRRAEPDWDDEACRIAGAIERRVEASTAAELDALEMPPNPSRYVPRLADAERAVLDATERVYQAVLADRFNEEMLDYLLDADMDLTVEVPEWWMAWLNAVRQWKGER